MGPNWKGFNNPELPLMLPAPYESVNRAIAECGFFTCFQPLSDDGGVRLVCASDGGAWGIGGISFWISFQAGEWYIASWGPCTIPFKLSHEC